MSLFLSTCSIINSSLSVITGVKQINTKFATILQPHKGLKISDPDRRRLVAVHRRVECLIHPLNFCVLWAKDQDSCVQPMIHYAYELLQSVTDFLDRVKFTADEVDPFTRVLDQESSQKVDYFLRELEFATASVSLAVSIAKFSGSRCEGSGRSISPSALLKASARILEMSNRSGDLLAVCGTLFHRTGNEWVQQAGESTMKVSHVRSIDPMDSPYLIRLGLGSGENVNFSIQTSLAFQVSSVKSVGLPIIGPIDSPVIIWKVFDSNKKRILHRNPSGDFEPTELLIDSSDEDTFLVRGATEVASSLKPRVSSTQITGTKGEYAFIIKSSNLSPLDVVYIARLCVLEAIRTPSQSDASVSSPRPTVYHALHLETSDEALTALLLDARVLTDHRTQEIALVVSEEV